ncbi:unnamed protein product [Nippostrongylus brasiliensis]|uniref:Uncharacterized helicase (inferred by orthology to a C. elegans protein) n=1 Tax=Nippostrongylus brasiliensis TaxID=27835 RepID=A0A0N4YQG9_NIPBR|nr:unnamed protein product [Nippostrongylus brasiliensis]
MSGNWDDVSDSDGDVVVAEKPVILPRARQPSIAKSLEKAAILESSVAGSVKESDASSDDDSESVGSVASEEFLETADEVLVLDFDTTTSMKKMIAQFECMYRNIISEFADVEIFIISLDSLIVECLAHSYHDWTLAGQSIVLTKQIDKFLQQFVNFGGKFKLVVFTDFALQFSRDTTLGFARATAIAHVSAGPFAKDLLFFTSPIDPNWERLLHDLTPSFIVCYYLHNCLFPIPVLDALAQAVPVVMLTSVVVNFSSVSAYYINPRLCVKYNWESFAAAHWECNSKWIGLVHGVASEHFESLCCAVLLSALVTGKRGASRIYLPEREGAKRGLDVIKDRRLLLTTATSYLEKLNYNTVKFSFSDFWDGRMVIGLFDAICANEPVLPYRVQEDFARLHSAAGLTKPIPCDTSERLFDPLPEAPNPLSSLPLLYAVDSPLIDKYIPELKSAQSDKVIHDGKQPDYIALLQEKLSWKLRPIEEDFTKAERLDLGMNMVYYQFEYGGELIDIQSDPRKDDRVTGFSPDAWQRKMLDSVDRGNSAVIVAPTSAGKTFVSYYCIERVLRNSDDDVVVYVSPSKALINQVCGSVYARFRNKSMTRGKSLFGTLNPEHSLNPLNCQVLVTVPESLEALMLSTNPKVQEFVSHIKYVIFDEVHSIGASPEAHIWEHLLLLIQCPFLALSATIGNAAKLHGWLDNAEQSKTDKKRRVDLIVHHERYSELELSIARVPKPQPIETYLNAEGEKVEEVPQTEVIEGNVIQQFMPYGLFMPEKIRMFGIPDDQQLTARQVLQLYRTMATVDEKTKEEFEPCKYYGYKCADLYWLSRGSLRKLEEALKKRLLQWLNEDEEKMRKVGLLSFCRCH